jgi:hypothetical protein
MVAAKHDRDVVRERHERERGVEGRVAAADHDDVPAREKRPVAGGAVRHAASVEPLLTVDAERTQRRSRRDDDRARRKRLAGAMHDALRAVDLESLDRVQQDLYAGGIGRFEQERSELVAGNPGRESGHVFDQRRIDDLTAGAELFHQRDGETVASRVRRGRQARDTGPDHDDVT